MKAGNKSHTTYLTMVVSKNITDYLACMSFSGLKWQNSHPYKSNEELRRKFPTFGAPESFSPYKNNTEKTAG